MEYRLFTIVRYNYKLRDDNIIIAYHNVARFKGLKCIQVIYAIVSRTMRLPPMSTGFNVGK